jgi:hypothetical protein
MYRIYAMVLREFACPFRYGRAQNFITYLILSVNCPRNGSIITRSLHNSHARRFITRPIINSDAHHISINYWHTCARCAPGSKNKTVAEEIRFARTASFMIQDQFIRSSSA